MLKFLNQVGEYAKETVQAAKYIGQGLAVTFDHMRFLPNVFGAESTLNLTSAFPAKSAFGYVRSTYL
jgi:hypothetical protein